MFYWVVIPSCDARARASGDNEHTERHVPSLILKYANTVFMNDGNLEDLRLKVEKRFI